MRMEDCVLGGVSLCRGGLVMVGFFWRNLRRGDCLLGRGMGLGGVYGLSRWVRGCFGVDLMFGVFTI